MIPIAVIGDECGLVARRITERAPQLDTRPIVGVVSAVFADDSESWRLRTGSGDEHHASVVVDTRALQLPASPGAGPRDDALVGVRGRTIQEVWRDGVESFFGISVHGFPNYFMFTGPDEQLAYIVDCLATMQRKGSARVEVRRSAQREYLDHGRVASPARAFEFTTAKDEIYDGPATLTVDGQDHRVRVRLTGHVDPIDGKYHWQGTVSDAATDLASQRVRLAVDVEADARITERTPWGSYSIAGVGAPPFDLT